MNDADASQSFEESFAMADELEEIFGRKVDLLFIHKTGFGMLELR